MTICLQSITWCHFITDAHMFVDTNYIAKNEQLVPILLQTGLNNVLLPTLLTFVNNNVQGAARQLIVCSSLAFSVRM